jgi:hypothetical protein
MLPDLKPAASGDIIVYVRNSDGSSVWGLVACVREALDSPAIFRNTQLREEGIAYELRLAPEDANRITHRVTLGHDRVVGILRSLTAPSWPEDSKAPVRPSYLLEGGGLVRPGDFVLQALLGWESPPEWSSLRGRVLVREGLPL